MILWKMNMTMMTKMARLRGKSSRHFLMSSKEVTSANRKS